MTPSERASGDGFVVESVPRTVFTVTGERPLAYLHDVLAQDVAGLTPGEGAIAAVLDAGGRVVAEVRVLVRRHDVLLDGEPAIAGGVAEHIARHAPLAGCEVADVSDRIAVAALRGPAADAAVRAAGLAVPGPAEGSFEQAGEVLLVRVVWGVPGIDIVGPREAVAEAIARIGSRRASFEELAVLLVVAGRPRFGADITADLLANETPLLRHGVSMTKGCYPGQESVARIANLGRVRRSLRGLRSQDPMAPGAAVAVGGADAGAVTSSAASPEGGWVAIAVLRDTAVPGGTVTVAGSDAEVFELP